MQGVRFFLKKPYFRIGSRLQIIEYGNLWQGIGNADLEKLERLKKHHESQKRKPGFCQVEYDRISRLLNI